MVRTRLPILLCLLLLLLPACGKKGPLRPKLAPLPAAPAEFGVRQLGSEMLLSWTLPAANQDGSALEGLRSLHLYRSEFELAEECPECRDSAGPYRRIDLEYLQQAQRAGNRLRLLDPAIRPGLVYRYRLVALDQAGHEGAPATARIIAQPPPPAPQQLLATPLDRQVRLSWQPVVAPAGSTLVGYNVYRRTPAEAFGERPVNLAPLTETSFDLFGLDNGQVYVFGVRSLVRNGPHLVESPLAETAPVTPKIGQ